VATTNLEIFSISRGAVGKIGGLRVDFRQEQVVLCKAGFDFRLAIHF
jgi:hypothetical protein